MYYRLCQCVLADFYSIFISVRSSDTSTKVTRGQLGLYICLQRLNVKTTCVLCQAARRKYPMQNGCTTLYIYTLYLSSLSCSWCTYKYSHIHTTKLNNVLLNSYGGPHTFASIVDIKRNKKNETRFAICYEMQCYAISTSYS